MNSRLGRFALVITNLRGGGAEKAFTKLGTLLAARGHEVHMVLLENIVEHVPPATISVHALTRPGQPQRKGFLGKRLAAITLRRLFRKLEQNAAFDLVVSTLPYADEVVALAKLSNTWYRIANTLSAEISALQRHNPAKAQRRRARYQRLYDGNKLIAVSDGVAADLRRELELQHAHIARIYNPFDADDIRRKANMPVSDLPGEPYFLHVGRFVPQKRHDLLFAAWSKAALPHKLVLLTPLSKELDQLIAHYALGERVIVAGFRRNPYPWIRKAAALVLCSDHEGLPNVLIEALICGTQIVSTDCPSGPREVMSGELARFLVPVDDADALAAALHDVLEHPVAIEPSFFARCSADAVAGEYEALAFSTRNRG